MRELVGAAAAADVDVDNTGADAHADTGTGTGKLYSVSTEWKMMGPNHPYITTSGARLLPRLVVVRVQRKGPASMIRSLGGYLGRAATRPAGERRLRLRVVKRAKKTQKTEEKREGPRLLPGSDWTSADLIHHLGRRITSGDCDKAQTDDEDQVSKSQSLKSLNIGLGPSHGFGEPNDGVRDRPRLVQ